MKKVWRWLATGLGVLVAGLLLAVRFLAQEKRNADIRARDAERNVEAVREAKNVNQRAAQAGREQRQENQEREQERLATPKEDRRRGNFGTADRLDRLRDSDGR